VVEVQLDKGQQEKVHETESEGANFQVSMTVQRRRQERGQLFTERQGIVQ
jgi:hypothetical protein